MMNEHSAYFDGDFSGDTAIVVAGGSGTRMGTAMPKQFLPLGGVPVLVRTLLCFARALPRVQLVVVLPQAWQQQWYDLCRRNGGVPAHSVAVGGATRFHSVQSALALLDGGSADDAVVGVHDAVRPLASADLIRRVYAAARQYGNAVPAVAVTDSVRQLSGDDGGSRQLLRDSLRAVQTPQAFRRTDLLAAYQTAFDPLFTDDASVVERAGGIIHLVEGEPENIKLTRPQDFVLAEYLISRKDG